MAGSTSVLGKCGVKKTDSDVATALRIVVVFLFSWAVVLFTPARHTLAQLSGRSLLFLILSGLATGTAWLCQFKALSLAGVSKVDPVDKCSTILTVLFAIFVLGETKHLPAKLLGVAFLGIGVYLMWNRKEEADKTKNQKGWLLWACLSAVFASLTSIFAKVGISDVDSNVANAIRSAVVILMAWGIVAAQKKTGEVKRIRKKEWFFILASGLTTALSWFFYYYAIEHGVVSVVVPIDKMSLMIAVLFSYFFLKERVSKKAFFGLGVMTAGTLVIALFP
jgi:transporter family protein